MAAMQNLYKINWFSHQNNKGHKKTVSGEFGKTWCNMIVLFFSQKNVHTHIVAFDLFCNMQIIDNDTF